jgi:hypothetical protein
MKREPEKGRRETRNPKAREEACPGWGEVEGKEERERAN